MNLKNLLYIVVCILFVVIIGGGIYEALAIWPNAFSALPKSLTAFQGEYGVNSVAFWAFIHPITILLFIVTIVLHWKSERKNYILLPFIVYAGLLITTAIYYVPELSDITATTISDTLDPSLQNRGNTWIFWNNVRAVIFLLSAGYLLMGLTKKEA